MGFEQPPSPEELAKMTKERDASDKELFKDGAKYVHEPGKAGRRLEVTDQQIEEVKIEGREEKVKESLGSGFGNLSIDQVREIVDRERERASSGEMSRLELERADALNFIIHELDKFEQWYRSPENSGKNWDDYLAERYRGLYKSSQESTSTIVKESRGQEMKNIRLAVTLFSIDALARPSEQASEGAEYRAHGDESKEKAKELIKPLTFEEFKRKLSRFYTRSEEGLMTLKEYNPDDKFSNEDIENFIAYTIGTLQRLNIDLQQAKKKLGSNVKYGTSVASIFGNALSVGGGIIQRLLEQKGRLLTANEILSMDIKDAIKQSTGFELDEELVKNL
ncbi:MAG: hypothetical protein UV58_C0006G0020 [Candidatus Wolfebacteria bacterium GW2011_GWC1_43_10]|uniref:Uncharacterized protein n=1 Tax=Candidatus Wolfebacteria bacterium GW2011_GWC1_43_10 TaxID=1619011 RepID=A0A0G1EI76_9BACT|nr:MAG: hypothetical protein UV58_C0006G0020 [Candidatus Wolfebacteria bacterium GW2011_GWC1_43_10]